MYDIVLILLFIQEPLVQLYLTRESSNGGQKYKMLQNDVFLLLDGLNVYH